MMNFRVNCTRGAFQSALTTHEGLVGEIQKNIGEKVVPQTWKSYEPNLESADLKVYHKPITRFFRRLLGKSEDNVPIKIKGTVSRSKSDSFDPMGKKAYSDTTTWGELKSVTSKDWGTPIPEFIKKLGKAMDAVKSGDKV